MFSNCLASVLRLHIGRAMMLLTIISIAAIAIMISKYFNPYTDFGFKKLFGEEGSKDLLIDFLNQLLPAHHQVLS